MTTHRHASAIDTLQTRFDTMRAAQAQAPFPDWSTRADRLRRLDALVRENRDRFAAAIDADFGHRATPETALFEVFPVLSAIRHALRHGRRWMRVRRAATGFWFLPAHSRIRPQPLGVVGVVSPWNYPLQLALWPAIDALTAGNRGLCKPSEATPRFGELLAELVAARFGDDEFAVVNGDAEVSRRFCALPFDHLVFTGSTAVGREVMRTAAANLTPVTLELGGKSPAILAPDAHFAHAVERIVVGKLVNAGQTCVAPDYVLLPRDRVDDFISAARACVARMYPDLADNDDYSAVARERDHQRLSALRDEAVAAGAIAHELAGGDAATRRFPPTLLTEVPPSARVMQEEIFGPILPLVACDTIDDAITHVSARPRPLALYLFARDRATIDRVLDRTCAGGVCVNDTLLHLGQHSLPFGGIGASGMGAYHGEHGFRRFSHMKPVFAQARINAIGWLEPPYRERFARLLRLLLRNP